MTHLCKICEGSLVELLRYQNMPRGAQHFCTKETMHEDAPITLIISQCSSCGTIQVPMEPVSYYRKAFRTTPWMAQDWRREQLRMFKAQFNLQFKKIKTVTEEPCLPERYNAFFMFNYLEHLPNPKGSLRRIWSNLEDPGVGLVEVPNASLIIKEHVAPEFVIDHLFYFTHQTLHTLLNLSGFEVLSMRDDLLDSYILSATVKKRQLLDLSQMEKVTNELVASIDRALHKYNKVAIWGAGHQAMFILSQCKMLHKISYVIDSSSRKQGMYIPVTRLPIVEPKRLIEDKVDAIILIVGDWHRDVKNQIRELKLEYRPDVLTVIRMELK